MAKPSVRILGSKMLYEGSVFGVRQDRLMEPGGVEVTRDIVVHRGSVVLLPVFADGGILLVRQYRHAIGDFLWELVAGRLEEGESRAAGARRELIEETGYSARGMKQILEIFPSPGFVTERMWVFMATGLRLGEAQPEEDERITAKKFPLAAVENMIRRGTLNDAKSVSAILFYSRFLERSARRLSKHAHARA